MVQILPEDPTRNVWGNIGKGFGETLNTHLSEQIPKEVERARLSQGLKKFSEESGNLTPLQQLAQVSTIPGVTPQMVQSFGELAKQQSKSQALKGIGAEGPANPFQIDKQVIQGGPNQPNEPNLTTANPLEETLKPYIPKSYQDILARAGQLYNANPALYKNDPDLAIQGAKDEEQAAMNRNQALQGQRTNEQGVQGVVQQSLQGQRQALGAQVPGNVYDEIETKAINAVKPKSQGGEGLTEIQAIKKYGKELDTISRQYQQVGDVGTWKIATATSAGNKAALRSIRQGFKERNDLENFADSVVAKNRLSPSKAYYLAYPVSETKALNNEFTKLPEIQNPIQTNFKKGFPEQVRKFTPDQISEKTYAVADKLASAMGKDGSPLAVAEELKARGYDPYAWLDYVDKHRKELDLSARQERELGKPRNFNETNMDDQWMFYFSGLDKLVEQ